MNNNQTFDFDKLPDKVSSNDIEEGMHIVTIQTAEEVYSQNGKYMLQLSYIVDNNENIKLNYDNSIMVDEKGNAVSWGQNKVKKIISATGLKIKSFTLKTLKPLLIGKSFKVYLTKNDKGYLQIEIKNISTITSVNDNSEPEFKVDLGKDKVEPKNPFEGLDPNKVDILSNEDKQEAENLFKTNDPSKKELKWD